MTRASRECILQMTFFFALTAHRHNSCFMLRLQLHLVYFWTRGIWDVWHRLTSCCRAARSHVGSWHVVARRGMSLALPWTLHGTSSICPGHELANLWAVRSQCQENQKHKNCGCKQNVDPIQDASVYPFSKCIHKKNTEDTPYQLGFMFHLHPSAVDAGHVCAYSVCLIMFVIFCNYCNNIQ